MYCSTACMYNIFIQILEENQVKMDGVCKELEEARKEEGRVRVELQGREERVKEMELEIRDVRDKLEEKDRLLKTTLEVRTCRKPARMDTVDCYVQYIHCLVNSS